MPSLATMTALMSWFLRSIVAKSVPACGLSQLVTDWSPAFFQLPALDSGERPS